MAKDVAGGCELEKELRHAESKEKGFAGKFSLRGIAKSETPTADLYIEIVTVE